MSTSDDTPTKICSKCGNEYPATTEYFARDAQKRDGLYSSCKRCNRPRRKSYYHAHVQQAIADTIRWQRQNPEKVKGYRLKLKGWQKAYREEHYKENRDRYLELQCKYYQANKHAYIKRSREWVLQNPERAKGNSRRRAARRRSREYAAPGSHTSADIERQIAAQTGKDGKLRCWWCGEVIEDQYHVDHRVPLSKGGSNDAGNLCITHAKCNLSKNNKMPWEFNGRLI